MTLLRRQVGFALGMSHNGGIGVTCHPLAPRVASACGVCVCGDDGRALRRRRR